MFRRLISLLRTTGEFALTKMNLTFDSPEIKWLKESSKRNRRHFVLAESGSFGALNQTRKKGKLFGKQNLITV